MIDDPQDVLTAYEHLTDTNVPATMSAHLEVLLIDINQQVLAMRRGWATWDADARHDALNELHCRWQDADRALMNAVRLSDFEHTQAGA